MDLPQRIREGKHTGSFHHPPGKRVTKRQHLGQRQRYRISDLPGDQLRSGRIQADQAGTLDHLDHRCPRIGFTACDGPEFINDDVIRVRELELSPELPHLADEDAAGPRRQLPSPVVGVPRAFLGHEEGSPQLPVPVGEHGLHPGGTAIHDGGRHHLRHDSNVLAGMKRPEIAHLGPGQVAARHMPQEVSQGD